MQGASPARRTKRELPQRERKAETARLDVRLLERPVIEKDDVLLVDRQRPQVGHFLRREEPLGHVVGDASTDVFDVDSDLAADGDRAGHEPLGV